MFLQPIILWGLPLVLLPILIHLLNRLRYRSVKWAAMMFLLRATRSSTRAARLRQFLILACRVLVVLGLVLGLARPQVGGWLGLALGGPPETVIILLDRSASMEELDPRSHISKREHALRLLTEAVKSLDRTPRLVLIDSATRAPQELASLDLLAGTPLIQATDTAADFPALVEVATRLLQAAPTGRTELWIASDMQRSNWQPLSSVWAELVARLQGLPQDLTVRVLALGGESGGNLGLALRELTRLRTPAGGELLLHLELSRQGETPAASVPVTGELNGAPLPPFELALDNDRLALQQRLPLGTRKGGGWGWLRLPGDRNPRDNTVYFAFGDDLPQQALVLASDAQQGELLKLAATPAPVLLNQSAQISTLTDLERLEFSGVALLLWQGGGQPTAELLAKLQRFVGDGGVLLLLPELDSGASPWPELSWGGLEQAPEKQIFPVAHWERAEGPLADTIHGESLALASLQIKQRRLPAGPGEVLAEFSDGSPLLLRQRLGRGQVLALATLPSEAWSDLAEGPVLVPMLQRLWWDGGRRLAPPAQAWCGEAVAETPDPRPLAGEGQGLVFPWHAGLYQDGERWLALNRPPAEDDREFLSQAELRTLLGALRLTVLEDNTRQGDRLQTEIWRALLLLVLLGLLGEAWLTAPAPALIAAPSTSKRATHPPREAPHG